MSSPDRVEFGANLFKPSTSLKILPATVGTGAVVGALLGRWMGGAVGALAGLGAGLATSAVLEYKHQDKQSQQHSRTLAALKSKHGLENQPNRTFAKAECYQGKDAWIIDFPKTKQTVLIENPGTKKRLVTVPESDAGPWLNDLNRGIEATTVTLFSPGQQPTKALFGWDPRQLNVTLTDDGKLQLSGGPEGRADYVYDLASGSVEARDFGVDGDGLVQHVSYYNGTGAFPTGYKYEQGQFRSAEGSGWLPPLPPDIMGTKIHFPEVKENGLRSKTVDLEISNDLFQAKMETTHQRDTVKKGYWLEKPCDHRVAEHTNVQFASGAQVTIDSQLVSDWRRSDEELERQTVRLDDQVLTGYLASVSEKGLRVWEPEKSRGFTGIETISPDGTVTWQRVSGILSTRIKFKPDGTVETSSFKPEEVPQLQKDGLLVYPNGYPSEQLPVPPARIWKTS